MARWQYMIVVSSFCCASHIGLAADTGLITKQSNHSVADTVNSPLTKSSHPKKTLYTV